jgi:HEAT repeat protein
LWIEDLISEDPTVISEAKMAVRKIGTNSIPYLLDILSYKESLLHRHAGDFLKNVPFTSSFLARGYMRSGQAALALNELGPEAKSCSSELTNLFYNGHSEMAGIALAGIGHNEVHFLLMAITNRSDDIRSAAIGGVPELLKILEVDADSSMRSGAAYSLGLLHQKGDLVIPKLIESLASVDDEVRLAAIIALGQYRAEAEPAISALNAITLNHKDADIRDLAKKTIEMIKGNRK